MKPFNNTDPRDATKMQLGQCGFQGDVKITKVSSVEGFDKMNLCSDNALAYGEHTGHLHQLDQKAIVKEVAGSNERFFFVPEGTTSTLRHQEHAPIVLSEGWYKVEIQKEYDHLTQIERQVRD